MAKKKTKKSKQKMSTKKKNIIIASALTGGIAVSVVVPLVVSSVLAPVNYAEEFRIVSINQQNFEIKKNEIRKEANDKYTFSKSFDISFDENGSNQWLTGKRNWDGLWSFDFNVITNNITNLQVSVNNIDGTYLKIFDVSMTLNQVEYDSLLVGALAEFKLEIFIYSEETNTFVLLDDVINTITII